MKLDKFELDKKLSIVDMKQVKAGSNPSCTGGNMLFQTPSGTLISMAIPMILIRHLDFSQNVKYV